MQFVVRRWAVGVGFNHPGGLAQAMASARRVHVAAEAAVKGASRNLPDSQIRAGRGGHGKAAVGPDVDRMAQSGEGTEVARLFFRPVVRSQRTGGVVQTISPLPSAVNATPKELALA